MDSIKNGCKATLLLLCFVFSTYTESQNVKIKQNTFVRVYDLDGKKIAKGKLISTTDKTLVLERSKKAKIIEIDDVGKIKTKRSIGNNILMGSSFGAGTAILFSTSSNESFVEGYAGIGTIVFTGLGAGIGSITAIFKNSKIFKIEGDKTKWTAFKNAFENSKK